jgi:hypothetical protein
MEVWAIRILSLEHDYKEITLHQAIERTSSSSEQSETYQRKKTFIYYCVFMIPIPIIIQINILA